MGVSHNYQLVKYESIFQLSMLIWLSNELYECYITLIDEILEGERIGGFLDLMEAAIEGLGAEHCFLG